MSIFLAGGRSATVRRVSKNGVYGSNYPVQWSALNTQRPGNLSPMGLHRDSASSIAIRRDSTSLMSRRRALDLYGTRDVVFTHAQVKKAKLSNGSAAGLHSFG
ncbi:unnamed protein product [Rotaria sp. Silwood1]|nr:unnamed protein product [Rotaria sp. Silwood1]CAF1618689.1 unnamed protein product [Rotaria sp. Silwood1]CAF1619596.1 unnamed protein product [Rotaria sp. Silwood1]CAF3789050.1 unnamed protein product [Rotaria sp. Silwood1]CAF3829886.1 unnamed protein product [Rotaria sp. Silwood1]